MIWLILVLLVVGLLAWFCGGRELLRSYRYRANARIIGAAARARVRYAEWLNS